MVAPRRRIEFHSDPTPEHRRIWPTVPLHTYLVATTPTVELAVSFRLDTRDRYLCSVLDRRGKWQGIDFHDNSQTILRRTTSGLHLAYIVDVPGGCQTVLYQKRQAERAVSCHMLPLICPSIDIHTPGFTSLALSNPHDTSTLATQHHRSASETSQRTFHPSLLTIAIFSQDIIA